MCLKTGNIQDMMSKHLQVLVNNHNFPKEENDPVSFQSIDIHIESKESRKRGSV